MSQGKDKTTFVEQVGGDHYQQPIQVWDFVIANKIGFLEGNVIKYVERWERKDGLKDLLKAKSYIEKLIAVETERLAQKGIDEAKAKQDPVATTEDLPEGWLWHPKGYGMPDVKSDVKVDAVTRNGVQLFGVKAGSIVWEDVLRWAPSKQTRVERVAQLNAEAAALMEEDSPGYGNTWVELHNANDWPLIHGSTLLDVEDKNGLTCYAVPALSINWTSVKRWKRNIPQ